ncbi:MAG: hypothetical protein HY910_01795 [Desulfarculus sp.]|nr:hypothetical protein [Desulfarculus sp.]
MNLLGHLERLAGLQAELTGQALACQGLIEQEQFAPLEDAMQRRRLLFAQVMALHQELGQAWPGLEEALAGLPPEQAVLAREVLRQITEQSARLGELDRRSAVLLEEVLARLRGELKRLGQGQRLLNAYRALPAGTRWGPDQLSRMG